jgi:hypothetical protein
VQKSELAEVSEMFGRKFSSTLVLFLVLTLTLSAALFSFQLTYAAENPAKKFYENSNTRVHYSGGDFYLRIDTPEPVLCAVNFEVAGKSQNYLLAMNMTAPAEDHDIALELKQGKKYEVYLTAFTLEHEVYRSERYLVNTESPEEGTNLIYGNREEPRVLKPEVREEVFVSGPNPISTGANDVRIEFVTGEPVLASTAVGESGEFGRLARLPERKPFADHELKILGLKAGTEYLSETIIINRSGEVYRSAGIEFETEPGEGGNLGKTGENLASSAEINDVSSIWGGEPEGSFGAKNAIDGEPGTEWSSQGEGNDAWIEVKLSERSRVVGFGFWTRTMGETGQISQLRVLTGDGRVIGEYEIPSADKIHTFEVPEVEAEVIRFEVLDSSGGNTGVREIKIFGTPLD